MRFRDIIGQENVKNHLRLSVSQGRVPHAHMLFGPSGVGKLRLAVAYAQYLNCPNRTAEDSCGTCPTCLQFQNLEHPDLIFVYPIVKNDKSDTCSTYAAQFRELMLSSDYFSAEDWYKKLGVENKQGLIYENESGEILRRLSFKSFGNGYKVLIIWQPEKMNTTCANKILKILEEPPEKTVFLLVSEHPEQMLPTILSRVQQIKVDRLSDADLSPYFPKDIIRISGGSYLEAMRLQAGAEERTAYFDDFVALMRRAWLVAHKRDYSALLELRKWSADMADKSVGREKQKAFLQYAQRQTRENYILNFGEPSVVYQTDTESKFSERFSRFINDNNVEQITEEFAKAERHIEQNGNAKIIFFDLCLQMIVLIKKA